MKVLWSDSSVCCYRWKRPLIRLQRGRWWMRLQGHLTLWFEGSGGFRCSHGLFPRWSGQSINHDECYHLRYWYVASKHGGELEFADNEQEATRTTGLVLFWTLRHIHRIGMESSQVYSLNELNLNKVQAIWAALGGMLSQWTSCITRNCSRTWQPSNKPLSHLWGNYEGGNLQL